MILTVNEIKDYDASELYTEALRALREMRQVKQSIFKHPLWRQAAQVGVYFILSCSCLFYYFLEVRFNKGHRALV